MTKANLGNKVKMQKYGIGRMWDISHPTNASVDGWINVIFYLTTNSTGNFFLVLHVWPLIIFLWLCLSLLALVLVKRVWFVINKFCHVDT